MTIQPIETVYRGYRLRSRLEARWCVLFDALGLPWEYEVEGYKIGSGYLPDFWLPTLGCFAEVKRKTFTEVEYLKCAALPSPCILLDTSSPKTQHGYYIADVFEWCSYKAYLAGDHYGRILLQPSQDKGRLWFLLGETPQDYWMDLKPEIAARSARFEHGETP